MSAAGASLLGREREVSAIRGLLDQAASGDSGAMALVGGAGNGKTTLLREAARLAEESAPPLTVLRARGVETEAEIAFGGLLELVRPLGDLIRRLPDPQARALEGALALTPGAVTDRFSVSAATLAILGEAASEGPVLVLVDDLHWLDPPSAQAILFACRRLWHERVAVLIGSRPEAHVAPQLDGIPLLEVGPLDATAAAQLARAAAGRPLAEREVEALVTSTGGNPLAIIEAARTGGGAGLPGDLIPVAERIRRGVTRRLDRLADHERRAALLTAAAGSRVATSVVADALAREGMRLDSLDGAEREGLVRVRGDVIEFEHPLTRSGVYASATGAEQRAAHRTLAESAALDSPARAWHLAAATVGCDEEAADALESAGRGALTRGAPSSALRAFERAAALSPHDDDAARRLLLAGDAARSAGISDRAREAIAAARDRTGDPLVRADALGLLLQMDAWRAPVATARTIAAEADDVVSIDRLRAARMLAEAASALARSGSITEGVALAERANAEMAALGTRDDLIELSLLLTRIMDARGAEAVDPLIDLGNRLAAQPPSVQGLALLHQVAWMEIWVERYEAADALLDHAVSVGRRDAPGTLPLALAMRGELSYRRGRLRDSLAECAEAAALAADFGLAHPQGLALTCRARAEACLGEDETCRATAAQAAAIGRTLGGEGSPVSAYGAPALGLLELVRGRPEEAVPHLERLVGTFRRGGIREPGVVLAAGDLIEAYAASGRREEAEDELGRFTAIATATGRTGALAIASRCRGLLAEGADMEAAFLAALRLHDSVDMPLERARTELLLGERLVARGRHAEGREHLERAHAAFAALGATPWMERATRVEAGGPAARTRVTAPRPGPGRSPEAHPVSLEYRGLGGFAVLRGGTEIPRSAFGRERARALLASLLCAGRAVHRDELLEWHWPDLSPARAVRAFHVTLHALRRAVEPGRERGAGSVIESTGEAYLVRLGADAVFDAARFLELAARARADGTTAALAEAEAAYGGTLFPEWEYTPWSEDLRRRCAAAHLDVLCRHARSLLDAGRSREAFARLERLVALEPEREEWHRELMLAYEAVGERALGLRQFHACRGVLREELGVEPSDETQRVYRRLLGPA